VTNFQENLVAAFWKWFKTFHREVEAAYSAGDTAWLDGEFTKRVRAIEPNLNWEIGPYFDPEFALVVSPSIRENIELAKEVICAAPQIAGWHFLPAKPPKQMTRLVITLPFRPEVEICGDEWSYRLTSYNNGEFFDIEVFTDAPSSMLQEDLTVLTHCLIEALIGEFVYLEKIEAVTVYRPTDSRSLENATSLRYLNEHLAGLIGE
jgi:hypothetical protein